MISSSPGSADLSITMSKGSTIEQLNAKTIGVNAYETLANLKSPASIEGAFENSFYIRVGEDELIRVIPYEQYVSASSIIMEEDDRHSNFKSMGVEQGMEVICGEKNVLIGKRFRVKLNSYSYSFVLLLPVKIARSQNASQGLEQEIYHSPAQNTMAMALLRYDRNITYYIRGYASLMIMLLSGALLISRISTSPRCWWMGMALPSQQHY